jgi:putative pyruvate formate lyase activating enzyme
VYNTGGYDSLETLKLLEGIVDIYMPDFKYASQKAAQEYSDAPDYTEKAKIALLEMQAQVGDLIFDEKGIALRGLLVRHLVLPQGLAGSEEVMKFLSTKISKNVYLNIMAQYYPCGDIPFNSPLGRRITHNEYLEAVELARKNGITRLDK